MYSTDTQANNLPTGEPPTLVIHDDDHLACGVPAWMGLRDWGCARFSMACVGKFELVRQGLMMNSSRICKGDSLFTGRLSMANGNELQSTLEQMVQSGKGQLALSPGDPIT
jgi:hypothetical protein